MAEVNPTSEIEEWRPIAGCEGRYSVSSFGHVRRDRTIRKGAEAGTLLRESLASCGYPRVGFPRYGRVKGFLVHILVAEAFLGPRRAERPEVNHKDGIKTNNRVANLEYVNRQENAIHSVRTGLSPTGDRHFARLHPDLVPCGESVGTSVLTADKVREIRRRHVAGETQHAIAADYSIHKSSVSMIVRRLSWKHVG